MLTPFLRRNEFLYPVREKDNPDFIVVLYGGKSQRRSYLRHHLSLGLRNSSETQTARNINHKHDRQLTFLLEHFDERPVKTCCHIPIYVANIVSVLVFSHFRESHTTPFEGRMIFTGKNIVGQSSRFNFDLTDSL